jgi:hypothetical protein
MFQISLLLPGRQITLMMEAVRTSVTLVKFYETIQHNIPEYSYFHTVAVRTLSPTMFRLEEHQLFWDKRYIWPSKNWSLDTKTHHLRKEMKNPKFILRDRQEHLLKNTVCLPENLCLQRPGLWADGRVICTLKGNSTEATANTEGQISVPDGLVLFPSHLGPNLEILFLFSFK